MICTPATDRSTSIIATKLPLESVVIVDGLDASVEPDWANAIPPYDIVICELGAKL